MKRSLSGHHSLRNRKISTTELYCYRHGWLRQATLLRPTGDSRGRHPLGFLAPGGKDTSNKQTPGETPMMLARLLTAAANAGPGSLLRPNAPWTQGGLMYAFPFR